MAARLRFKRCFRCEVLPGEGVFLLSETRQLHLRGRLFLELAPLLDGRYTEDGLVLALRGRLSSAEVFFGLGQLRKWGLVVESSTSSPPGPAAFWDAVGEGFEQTAPALVQTRVTPVVLGGRSPTPLRQSLTAAGLQVGSRGAVRAVVSDSGLRPELASLNHRSLKSGQPWLLVKPVGLRLWVGPLFVPGRTGCWECLAHRLNEHREVERFLERRGSTSGPVPEVPPSLPAMERATLSLAATQLARWVALGRTGGVEGKVVTLDAVTLETREHLLTRRPQCPACGDVTLVKRRQQAPISLQPSPTAFISDGGHRTRSPRQTLERLEHHVSPITGLIGEVRRSAPAGRAGELAPSYVTDRCSLHLSDEGTSLRESLRSRAGGKGRTEEQARASALCEAIERYSGIFQGDEARVSRTLRSLGAAAIHPNALLLFSQAQLRRGQAGTAPEARQAWLAEPFDERARVDWSPVWSLTQGERRYVPTALCYFGYAQAHGVRYARADSNGCAAGNTLEEAILQGFLELVERDSVALWWFNRARRPAVDLDSFGEPYFQELRVLYASLGRELYVLDLTSDLDIPVMVAVSRSRQGGGKDGLLLGFGAHLDPRLAVQRALTEVNQSLPAVLPRDGAPDAATAARALGPWSHLEGARDWEHLLPAPHLPARTAGELPRHGGDDLAAAMGTCVRLAAGRGLETLVLDQTRPDTGLHVVRVMVPGLRHFWARLAPGRLYDVPVRLGWVPTPPAEHELNPDPVYA